MDAKDMQATIQKPLSYFATLGSAVVSGITGGVAGAALGPVGLVTMFFQVMFTGIAGAEAKKKMHTLVMEWQDSEINNAFQYNQLQEELIKAQIRSSAQLKKAEVEKSMSEARLIHFFLSLVVVIIAIVLLFVVFPRKK